MPVISTLQQFLDQINGLKPQLAAIGYKPNQTNTREAMARVTASYVTKYDRQLWAIDDVVYHGHYPVPLRIYHPEPGVSLPVAVFIHGGGHMCGSITVYDGIARRLAAATQYIIVAIDYRLAPEFPYPTGLQDCKAVIRSLFQVLQERKIAYRNRDLTLIGDSGGAALCTSLVMDKEFVATEQIKCQVLIYPSVDYTLTSPTVDKYGEGYFLEKSKIAWYFDNYLQNAEDRKQVSPVYGEFYANMPTSLVLVAEYDPLHAEGEAYYRNLVSVGVKAELVAVPGVIHAYLLLEDLCPAESDFTYQEIGRFLASAT